MLDAQQITGRMIARYTSVSGKTAHSKQQLSREILIQRYLQAFGITAMPVETARQIDNLYPPVFKPKHALEWGAYLRQSKTDKLTPETYLNLILQFLQYMQHLGLNPFIRKITPPRSALQATRFSIQNVYKDLLYAALGEAVSQMILVVRRTHLLTDLHTVGSAVTDVRKIKGVLNLCSSFNLKPRRARQTLDEVLHVLGGFLYKGNLPPPLARQWVKQVPGTKLKPKSLLLPAPELMRDVSTLGWLVLARRPQFQISVRRSKNDTLVLRISMPLTPSDGTDPQPFGHKAKQVIISLWRSAITDLK